MSHTLGKWNTMIFLGQVGLLAVVAVVAYVTQVGVQATVMVGLGGITVLTVLHAMGAMKQERDIVYDLSIGNASGLVSLTFFILAAINYGNVPANVAAGCLLGGMFFLVISVALAVSAARVAKSLGAQQKMWELVLAAAPLGVGLLLGR